MQEKLLQNQRNTNIEILRLLLMTFIFLWHIIMHGFGFKYIGSAQLNINLISTTFLCSLFSPAVYCFMFISGWYGIFFSYKKLCYLVFLGVCCSILSNVILFFWTGKTISLGMLPTQLFPITCSKWWFLTYYTMIYLLSPFIECGFKHIDRKLLNRIMIYLTFIEVISIFQFIPKSGSTLFGLLYIYILARYIRIQNINIKKNKLIILYISSFLLLWGICFLSCKLPGNKASLAFILLGYNNPLIIIMALSIFLLINQFKPTHNNRLNKCLSSVLVIYLMTEGIGKVFYPYCKQIFSNSVILGVLLVLTITIICLIIGFLLSVLYNRILFIISTNKTLIH